MHSDERSVASSPFLSVGDYGVIAVAVVVVVVAVVLGSDDGALLCIQKRGKAEVDDCYNLAERGYSTSTKWMCLSLIESLRSTWPSPCFSSCYWTDDEDHWPEDPLEMGLQATRSYQIKGNRYLTREAG